MKFFETKRLIIRPFLKSDISEKYISWLNDPEVNEYLCDGSIHIMILTLVNIFLN